MTHAHKPLQHIQCLAHGEGTIHSYNNPKPDSQILGIRGSGTNSSTNENSTAIANDTLYHVEFNNAVFVTIQDVDGNPKSLEDVRSRMDWPKWQEAINIEMKTLKNAGTWHKVVRPQGKNIIDCKWVFKIKRKADSSIQKYKAHLVAHSFTQIQGVDYYETYSPVARMASFCTIIMIAAQNDWDINSFNFDSTYLNRELDKNEEIYMEFPPGYEPQGKDTILRLNKTLYGLKQAGR